MSTAVDTAVDTAVFSRSYACGFCCLPDATTTLDLTDILTVLTKKDQCSTVLRCIRARLGLGTPIPQSAPSDVTKPHAEFNSIAMPGS